MIPISLNEVQRHKDYVMMYQLTRGAGKVVHFLEMDGGSIIQWKVLGNQIRPTFSKQWKKKSFRYFEWSFSDRSNASVSDRRGKEIYAMMNSPNAELFRLTKDEFLLHTISDQI